MFATKKDELNAKKLEMYKAKDQAGYIRVFREGQAEFNKCIITITQKACEWIEFDMKNYQLSYQTYMEDEEKRKKLNELDGEVRVSIETKEIVETEE